MILDYISVERRLSTIKHYEVFFLFFFFLPFSFFFVKIESHYIALADLELCSIDHAGLELGDPFVSAFWFWG